MTAPVDQPIDSRNGSRSAATSAAASSPTSSPIVAPGRADTAPADSAPAYTAPADTAWPAAPHRPRRSAWGRSFDPDNLAGLELGMWKAYYRRKPARLFGLLILAEHEQAGASWPAALAASLYLTRAAVGFARASGDYDRFAPDIARGYRLLGLPATVDVAEVARRELRWWTIRRELGLTSGEAAGESIARLYSALYEVPVERVAEAGRLRGVAAEVRDRGATADPDGPTGPGRSYWPEVARLLRASYRELRTALDES